MVGTGIHRGRSDTPGRILKEISPGQGKGATILSDDDGLEEVAAAQVRLEQARTQLHDAVTRARAHGHTWAQIGEVLGMTRQAAFKRFGSPRDPRTGENMSAPTTTDDLLESTERIFRLIDAGDYEALRSMMSTDTAAVLTREVILGTWAEAVAETGNLIGCRDTGLELPDGTSISPGEAVHGSLIGYTMIDCEAGQWMGRVAYAPDRQVVGLLIVPPDHEDLPF